MDDEELALSRSTPAARIDVPMAAPAAPAAAPAADAEAERFVDDAVSGTTVVMFALQWCEFCWSVRKLFDRAGIAYRSVDLDAVEMQPGDLGGRVRRVLAARTGATTIPQLFIAGEHVGGCTDLFDGWRDGSIQERLTASGVRFDPSPGLDPYALLPKWLQPRRSA
jgi:cysteine synthase A